MVLNVYSGIAKSRGFENAVATTALTRLPEVVFTDLFQITKSNPFGIRFHLIDDFRNASHETMVALLILFAKGDSAHNADVRRRRAWNGFLRNNTEGIRRSIESDPSDSPAESLPRCARVRRHLREPFQQDLQTGATGPRPHSCRPDPMPWPSAPSALHTLIAVAY